MSRVHIWGGKCQKPPSELMVVVGEGAGLAYSASLGSKLSGS